MYLTKQQLDAVLATPFFTSPVTYNEMDYTSYRGRTKTSVHTVRFNLRHKLVDQEFILQNLIDRLDSKIDLGANTYVSVDYDLVLSNGKKEQDDASFYIWRSNSNQAHFEDENEPNFVFTYDNLFRLVRKASLMHIPSLEVYFASSNVVIDELIACVFSFIKL